MTQKQLITIDDIAQYRPLSKDIPADRINPFINEAQRIDIGQMLGRTLYYDFLDKFDANPVNQPYVDLLNGKVYQVSGQSVQYEGIKPCHVYFALARFFENNPINVTKYGLVQKLDESSTPLDPAIIKQAITSLKSVAIQYQHDVEQFLADNVSIYPLALTSVNKSTNKTGVKFF